jgi:starch synthase
MWRKEGLNRKSAYSYHEIFEGEIVIPNKISGYWSSSISSYYPNPFLVKLCKSIWRKYPQFLIICEGL